MPQLPYPIFVDKKKYNLPGATTGAVVQLDFRLFTVEVDDDCKAISTPIKLDQLSPKGGLALGTQVRGFIQLWGRSVDYYKNYQYCLRTDGLENCIINPQTSEWKLLHGEYTGRIVTSGIFEGEIAEKVGPELMSALKRFLPTYSIWARQEIPNKFKHYNYFVMSAPGRVAYRKLPISMFSNMLREFPKLPVATVPKENLEDALSFGIREIDRYLHQLLAMCRLSKEGEPELALVGCVTAIEWYMNSLIRSKDNWQMSIRDCLKDAIFKDFPERLKQQLREIALQRNEIVHSQPPERNKHNVLITFGSHPKNIDDIVEIGLDLYRETNLKNLRPSSSS